MAKKESLRDYQDIILKKMDAARMSDVGQMDLLFGFRAANKNFLISGKDVSKLSTPSVLEPIPVSKPWAVGAANIKGSVYSVTDFSVLIGGNFIVRGKFLILESEVMPGSALLIESLTGLFEQKNIGEPINDASMKEMPRWILSCHNIADDRHYLVDAALMAADDRFSKLQSGEI